MYKDGLSLAGKVALVTGARRGIGRGIALAFAEAGADVAICSRTGGLEGVAGEIRALGRRALAIGADISRKADVQRMVDQVMEAFGDIDILVNNASISHPAPLMETEEEVWDRIMQVNLKGYLLCAQAAARRMIARRQGAIINVSSRLGLKGTPIMGAYGVAKAGELMLTRILAVELAPYHIRVNAIAPGLTRTEGSQEIWGDADKLRRIETGIPLGRIAEPQDIVGAALFLASDISSYITGQVLVVDGGVQA